MGIFGKKKEPTVPELIDNIFSSELYLFFDRFDRSASANNSFTMRTTRPIGPDQRQNFIDAVRNYADAKEVDVTKLFVMEDGKLNFDFTRRKLSPGAA